MTDRKTFVFIGSSSEGKHVALQIQAGLFPLFEAIVWDQGVFAPSANTLESLVSKLREYDFAIVVFWPDDLVESRDITAHAPRDNVLIELGLFIGAIGRHRTFVVYDQTAKLKIPSDLAGVTLVAYEPPQSGSWAGAVGPACLAIRTEMERQGKRRKKKPAWPPKPPPVDSEAEELKITLRIERHKDILGANAAPPGLDLWYSQLRPVLHESAYYTTPTYFLDCDLNIIDWNIAFELIFREITPVLRYEHVNALIARLLNHNEVFNHGKDFTRRVHNGELPFSDTERLIYRSSCYGDVLMHKVATQLHDAAGELRGWSVALLLEVLDWPLFEKHLHDRIAEDKLWSVYASAYDLILLQFPPYNQLLQDVASVVPQTAKAVIDIGAGTGNSTEVLLAKGFNVTSVEFSATMIDRMRTRGFDRAQHRVIKARAENLNTLRTVDSESFDGATLVNMLYSVDEPFACLTGVNRMLVPGGVMGLSTTHAGVHLDGLLTNIRNHLVSSNTYNTCLEEYQRLYDMNKEIERTIAKRYSCDEYQDMIEEAGFEIIKRVDFTYEDAVMLIHARKL